MTRCEYCCEDLDGFVTAIEKNGHAFVRQGVNGWVLSMRANRWSGEAPINFCPMCGRKLTETPNVVEVVRCRNCIFREDDGECTGPLAEARMPAEWFCASGKRREEDMRCHV